MDIEATKLQKLKADGLTDQQIADCLGLRVEEINAALVAPVSFADDVDSLKPLAVKTMRNIMQESDNDGARAKVAIAVLDYTLEKKALEGAKLSFMFEEMRRVIEKHEEKFLNVSSSVKFIEDTNVKEVLIKGPNEENEEVAICI